MAALPTPRFDEFYRFDPLTELLFAYAEARPNLVSVRSIGQSHEGRDIWVLVLTNTATGADLDKPAFWLDGNIHAAELAASTTCLYYLNDLLTKYGAPDEAGRQVTHLLDTRVIYMVPRLNPDGAELALADRPRHIRSSTRPYPYDEVPVDGLTIEDVDGDGRILSMRVPDPHGGYKKHADDPRLMVAREPGEFGGEYFRLIPEGFIKHHDGLTVTVNKDREGLARFHIQHGFAGGTGLADGVFLVEHQNQRAGFRHAVALLQNRALVLPDLQNRIRRRGAADTGECQPAHVGFRELRMLAHELIVCRHAEQMRDPDGRIADQPQRLAGVEAAHDHHRAADLEHRIGKHVQAAGMEQRQQTQKYGGARDAGQTHAVDGVPEVHTVGDDRTLRPAGRAGRVKDGRDIVQRRRQGLVQR